MPKKKQNLNEIKQLKAEALKRRMGELDLGELDLAQKCGFTKRDAVTKWRAGVSWPYAPGEAVLEQALKASVGFFARIAEGIEYEKALINAEDKSSLERTLDDIVRHFLFFYNEKGEKWDVIRQQIVLFGKDLAEKHPELAEGEITGQAVLDVMAALDRIAKKLKTAKVV